MAVLAVTLAGGLLGGAIGGTLAAVSLGLTIGGFIGQTFFGPTIKGPQLQDLKVSASTYGNPIPEVYGVVRVSTNMIWSTGIRETKHTSRGKGGPKRETYTYDCTFAMALCKGPIDGILRIWGDGKLIYDVSGNASRDLYSGDAFYDIATSIMDDAGWTLGKSSSDTSGKFKMRVYKGGEDQLPDSLIEADKGVGSVSAYRGIAYIVFENFELEDFANRIPAITVEVSKAITGNFPSIVAKTEGGEVVYSDGKSWYPDWVTGLLYMSDNTGSNRQVTVFDMTTMTKMYSGPGSFSVGGRACFIPGTGIALNQIGASNSRPFTVTNWNTFSSLGNFGVEGNALGMIHLNGAGQYVEQYSADGTSCANFHTGANTPNAFVLNTSWTRDTICFRPGNRVPLFITSANYTPGIMIAGKTGTTSEIIGWRSNSLGWLDVTVWTIPSGSAGSYQYDPIRRYVNGSFSVRYLTLTPFMGETYRPELCLYDASDNCLFSMGMTNGVPCSFKYELDSNSYKFKVKYSPDFQIPRTTMQYSRLYGGTLGYIYPRAYNPPIITQIDLQSGAILQENADNTGSNLGQWHLISGNQHWDDLSNSVLLNTGTGFRRVFLLVGSSGYSIRSVVEDVCRKTNVLVDSDFDVSDLNDDLLAGYQIDRECTARDVLKQLATAYLFDGYESDYKLKFRSRGNPSVTTITEDWLGRDSEGLVVKESLTQELEMPMRITVNFYDITRDHQQGSQSAKRNAGPVPTMWTTKEDRIDLPIAWSPTQAVQCADKLLKMTWANRWSFTTSMPWKYLKYDPTDVVTVSMHDGTTYMMRLNEVTIGANFSIEAVATSEKATAYVSNAVGTKSDAPIQTIPGSYPCSPVILNTPLLRDEDYTTNNLSVTYLTASTSSAYFNGAQIFMSEDLVEYDSIASIGSGIQNGTCLTALPKTKAYESTDETTVIRVRMTNPYAVLESVEQETMLTSYLNAAIIGDEVIQFRDAVKQTNGEWHLSGILRARRGTNYAVNSHTVGERFVLLSEATIAKWSRTKDNYVTTRLFKAASPGSTLDEAVIVSADLIPRDLMPFTPENFAITDDDTTVTITCQRRSRVTEPLVGSTGYIGYNEGDKLSAKIKYEIWPGLTLTDVNTVETPAVTGVSSLFDGSGNDIPAAFSFPLSSLSGQDTFLLKAYEVGYVDGIPKWIEFTRLDENRWNATDSY